MKINLSLAAAALLATAVGSYVLGFYRGKEAMDGFAGNLISGISATIRGESLPILLSAADALKYPEQQEVQKTLRRYARTQASVVKECAMNKACSALAGQPLPQASLVELALSYK
jgi:hypothetical protein